MSLGVKGDFSKEPHSQSFPLRKPIDVAGERFGRITLTNHSFDRTFAPAGRSVLSVMIPAKFETWEKLGVDKKRYLAEKKKIAEAVSGALAERYPGISSKVEAVDVATLLTFARYTGNWKGSYEGWLLNRKTMLKRLPLTLPGLAGFYMAGQWVSPGGGLPGAAIPARLTIRRICRDEKVRFTATKE